MNLKQCLLINNNCYKTNRKITVKGLMLHSTGANNPNLKRYVQPNDGLLGNNTNGNHWNQSLPEGAEVCVHGFIGKLADGSIATYQTLPWTMEGWHAGGSANKTHIGVEICEDDLTSKEYFEKVYKEATELFAYLCKEFNLNPLTDIICHSEGFKKGIASNHSDVMHWLPKFGKSMDTFRNDVNSLVIGNNISSNNAQNSGTIVANNSFKSYLVKINTPELNVRQGAGTNYKINQVVLKNEVYTIVEEKMNGTTKWGKLKSGAGWISLAYTEKLNNTNAITNNYLINANYKGSSIVDALNQIGINSSFENRKMIAQKNGINNYTGTTEQNLKLLELLKKGKMIK